MIKEDSELLELTAKALGLKGYLGSDFLGDYFCVPVDWSKPRSEAVIYRWLDDNADAFGVALDLNFDICIRGDFKETWIESAKLDHFVEEKWHGEGRDWKDSATRRAIVRAAAEIGEIASNSPLIGEADHGT